MTISAFAQAAFQAILSALREGVKSSVQDLLQEGKDEWQSFVQECKKQVGTSENLVFIEAHSFNQRQLIALVQLFMVEGSSEVYAWKKEHKGFCVLHLTYGKDGIPFEKDNRYVNLRLEVMSQELIELFGDKELIVLQ